jgi:hypothetical protein
VFGVFGAKPSRGGRRVPEGYLLRHLPQRDDWQVLLALVKAHHKLQVDAWIAPDQAWGEAKLGPSGRQGSVWQSSAWQR